MIKARGLSQSPLMLESALLESGDRLKRTSVIPTRLRLQVRKHHTTWRFQQLAHIIGSWELGLSAMRADLAGPIPGPGVYTAPQGLVELPLVLADRLANGWGFISGAAGEGSLWPFRLPEPVASPVIPRKPVFAVRMYKARQGSSTASHCAIRMDE